MKQTRMEIKKDVIIAVGVLLLTGCSVALFAQEKTGTIKTAKKVIEEKFPSSRFLMFEYEALSPTDYDSKIGGEGYEKGRIKNADRYIVTMNYPIYKSRQLVVMPGFRYKYESYLLDNVVNHSANHPVIYHGNTINTHQITASLKTTYVSKLFDRMALYTLMLAADASDNGYERLGANLIGLIVLKRDARAKLAVGLVATYDRTSNVPVFPLVSYEYKVKNVLVFDMFFPKYVQFRKSLFADRGRLSVGTVLEKDRFFLHPHQERLADSYTISKVNIKSGLVYEHYLNKHFIFTAKGGLATPLKWNVTKTTSNKTVIDYSGKSGMYFNIGFSYSL